MKIAFFSDIHANLPALESVLADIDQQAPDAVYCLGDLVGYHVWPDKVVEAIRRRHIPTIAGNYDEGIGLNSDECGCAYKTEEDKARGAVSISYTNSVVSEESRAYLRSLPRHIRLELQNGGEDISVLMVHGSPRKINEYLFEDRAEKSLRRIMNDAGADIMLFGHTHKPFHRVLEHEIKDKKAFLHAINIGSVGKPKDGDPRAGYVILTFDENVSCFNSSSIQVEFRRVQYDVEKAAAAIENSPLPDAYADMLRKAY